MLDILIDIVAQTASVLYESSLYILVGFVVAGILAEFLPTSQIGRHLGGNDARSVTLAALFGAPIPLCSCGVLPTAAALQAKGASRPALVSFLISTPETGVDSIALTYGLLGPVMAIVRPIVAVITAIVAGFAAIATGDRHPYTVPTSTIEPDDGCQDDACGAGDDSDSPVHLETGTRAGDGMLARTSGAMRYGFGTLLDEIAFWLAIGLVMTGILSALLPDDFFTRVLGWDGGIIPMLFMVVAGVPLYLCASASTPVAAALIAKGLSPGAALVFLLVGPATNAATLTVVGRLLGSGMLRVYLGSIVLVSIAAGLLLDVFAADAVRGALVGGHDDAMWLRIVKTGAAVLFIGALIASFQRTRFAEGRRDTAEQLRRLSSSIGGFRLRSLFSGPVVSVTLAVLVIMMIPNVVLIVGPGQSGIVQELGRVVGSDLEPGLWLHWPPPFGRGTAIDADLVREVEVGFRSQPNGQAPIVREEAFYLTADENIVDIRAVIRFRIDDPLEYALGVEDAATIITSLARRELVSITSHTAIDALYTTERRSFEDALRERMRARIGALPIGCELIDTRLIAVHAPSAVHESFRDVASSLEDKQRIVHEASGYATIEGSRARGAADAIGSRARADATRSVVLADAHATAFNAIAAVHLTAPVITETRLHFETLERALAAPRKFIHASEGTRGEIDLWLGGATRVPPAGDEE